MLWPFNKKIRRRLRIENRSRLTGRCTRSSNIQEFEILNETRETYELAATICRFWILKTDSDIVDIDGEEQVEVAQEGNVFTILPRRK
ncbi:MAG: hypothetical protein WD605_00295 [Candidatus Paceibacterota bacterium]